MNIQGRDKDGKVVATMTSLPDADDGTPRWEVIAMQTGVGGREVASIVQTFAIEKDARAFMRRFGAVKFE